MSKYRFGYRDGRYRGFTGTDRVGLLGLLLYMILGIGLPVLLTMFLRSHLPLKWAMAAMAGAIFAGAAMCRLCKRRDWPLLSFFQLFTCVMVLLGHITLKFQVLEAVAIREASHLRAVSIGVGVLTTILLLRWMKKREDRPSPFLRVFFALFLGFLAFGVTIQGLAGVNVLADSHPSQSTTAQVLRVESEHRMTVSRYSSGSYTVYFAVVKENDLTRGGRFPVDKGLYDDLRPGDQVQLLLHPGALGAPWLECLPLEE